MPMVGSGVVQKTKISLKCHFLKDLPKAKFNHLEGQVKMQNIAIAIAIASRRHLAIYQSTSPARYTSKPAGHRLELCPLYQFHHQILMAMWT